MQHSKIFNFLCNTNFTDVHTGLSGYNLKIFKTIKLSKIDSGINFDSHLRMKVVNNNFKIVEVPIKTYYRSERSSWHVIYSSIYIKHLIVNIFSKIK